jgi:hypothetical protein
MNNMQFWFIAMWLLLILSKLSTGYEAKAGQVMALVCCVIAVVSYYMDKHEDKNE